MDAGGRRPRTFSTSAGALPRISTKCRQARAFPVTTIFVSAALGSTERAACRARFFREVAVPSSPVPSTRSPRSTRTTPIVLIVSHDLAALPSLCTRCLMLAEGRIAADGPTTEVIELYRRTYEGVA